MNMTQITKKLKYISTVLNSPYEGLESTCIRFDEKELSKEYQDLLREGFELSIRSSRPTVFFLTVAEIQQKKYISVKEFEIIYGRKKSWQAQRRSRVHDALPVVTKPGANILYDKEEVEAWMRNNEFK